MGERVDVRNTADPKQVERADRKARRLEAQRDAAYLAVLRTPAGRAVFWDLIAHAGTFESIWEPSAKIHYNAGRQDYGHWLMARLLDLDEELYNQMAAEARLVAKKNAAETDAAHTPSVTDGATT